MYTDHQKAWEAKGPTPLHLHGELEEHRQGAEGVLIYTRSGSGCKEGQTSMQDTTGQSFFRGVEKLC